MNQLPVEVEQVAVCPLLRGLITSTILVTRFTIRAMNQGSRACRDSQLFLRLNPKVESIQFISHRSEILAAQLLRASANRDRHMEETLNKVLSKMETLARFLFKI